MKTIAFILHANPAYAINWKNLIIDSDPETVLVLVGNENSIKALSDEDRAAFANVFEVNQFNFPTLLHIIPRVCDSRFMPGDKVKISAVTEYDVLLCAELRDHFREKYSIEGPGVQTITNFRDKLAMKQALGPKGVRLPRYEPFDKKRFNDNVLDYVKHLEVTLTYPMFVKPIDGASSVNTDLLENRDQLIAWCQKHSEDTQQFEIDEFIEGDLFHCDSIIQNGKIEFTFVSQYLHPNADARFGQPLASMTMHPDHPDYNRLKEFAENTLRCFPSVPDGCTHLEVFISKKNNELIFLEVGARPPGARAPEVYKLRSNGVDIRAVHTRLNIGLNVDQELAHLRDQRNFRLFASMWDIVNPAEGGVIQAIKPPNFDGKSQFTSKWKYKIGDLVPSRNSNLDVIGSVIFWNDDYDKLLKDFMSLDNQVVLVVGPNPVVSNASLLGKRTATFTPVVDAGLAFISRR